MRNNVAYPFQTSIRCKSHLRLNCKSTHRISVFICVIFHYTFSNWICMRYNIGRHRLLCKYQYWFLSILRSLNCPFVRFWSRLHFIALKIVPLSNARIMCKVILMDSCEISTHSCELHEHRCVHLFGLPQGELESLFGIW